MCHFASSRDQNKNLMSKWTREKVNTILCEGFQLFFNIFLPSHIFTTNNSYTSVSGGSSRTLSTGDSIKYIINCNHYESAKYLILYNNFTFIFDDSWAFWIFTFRHFDTSRVVTSLLWVTKEAHFFPTQIWIFWGFLFIFYFIFFLSLLVAFPWFIYNISIST